MVKLIYIGAGAFLPDIPARDLSAAEVKQHGGAEKLVKTGLYKLPAKPPRKKKSEAK